MSAGLLDVRGLSKTFAVRRGFMGGKLATVQALDGVSFSIGTGEAFGLVGESGCGKSTAGRAILRLIDADSGTVLFKGESVFSADTRAMRRLRRQMQIVFQDPYSSLNPRRTISQTLSEPMRVHGMGSAGDIRDAVRAALGEVGMPSDAAGKYPHEFSGGQRQRIGIARALVLQPELIVADEPVSALDVSIQAQILVLLRNLQQRRNLSFVFISHDLGVVRHFCRSVAVMYLGRIVERGPVPGIFDEPLHPYTRALRNASPVPDPAAKVTMAKLEGEVASALAPPSGCHFHPRCPHATETCRQVYPTWTELGGGRGVACHLYPSEQAGAASS
ncbi:MAG TPA: oligopeptide/dipeptide ABC transporter ATP-binding protein [Stellaceae bacterium]|nr:oligopeptide/dipeptide ABC transporter ATP-binding protein [Stellaceae bacterium]